MEMEYLEAHHQKSFYGKAEVYKMDDGWTYLKSYHAIMLGMSPRGLLYKHSNVVSDTTMRHVNAFLVDYLNEYDKMSKREFLMLPIRRNRHEELEEEK